jgi:hypothetical protein
MLYRHSRIRVEIFSMRVSPESERSEAIRGMKRKEMMVKSKGRRRDRYAGSNGQLTKMLRENLS